MDLQVNVLNGLFLKVHFLRSRYNAIGLKEFKQCISSSLGKRSKNCDGAILYSVFYTSNVYSQITIGTYLPSLVKSTYCRGHPL